MDEATRKDWGQRIRERRQAIGLSQTALAELARTDQGTISKVERGEYRVTDDFKWRIAGALRTTVVGLFPYPAVIPPAPVEQVA